MRQFIFLTFMVLPSMAFSESIIGRCRSVFSKSKPIALVEENLQHLYSKELFLKIHEEIENSSLLSQKEKKDLLLKTKKSIQFIESHSQNQKLEVLTPQLLSAIESLPALFKFTETQASNPYLDTKTALKLVVISLTLYTSTYIRQESNHLDWPRLGKILSAITDFKSQPNDFSLYKILRAVKEKHSFKELIKCK